MAVYFAIAALAFVLSLFGQKCADKSRLLSIVLYSAAIFIFCYFAGARDLYVGSDTKGYAFNSYQLASSDNPRFFWDYPAYASWGVLFKLLCLISVQLTHSFFWYLFAIEFVIVVPVAVACLRSLDKYAPLGILVYGVVFYPMSFNMMRQMACMGFLLLGYLAVTKRKPFRFWLFFVIAFGIHSSAITGALIYPLIYFARGRGVSGGIKLGLVFIAGLAFVSIAPYLLNLFSSATGYYQNYSGSGSFSGSPRTLAITIVVAFVIGLCGYLFMNGDRNNNRDERIIQLAAIVVFGIVCLALSLLSFYLYRVAFFFIYFTILLIPMCCSGIKDSSTRYFFLCIVLVSLMFWSFDYYSVQGSHQVVPYLLAQTPY